MQVEHVMINLSAIWVGCWIVNDSLLVRMAVMIVLEGGRIRHIAHANKESKKKYSRPNTKGQEMQFALLSANHLAGHVSFSLT